MKVLLSIKPEFADKIFNGTKKFEFRRIIFKQRDIDKVIVYASSPVQRVIGEFSVEDILSGSVDDVWTLTNHLSGISEIYYRNYFFNKQIAYAIKIGRTLRYRRNRQLSEYNIDYPPQSYMYL